MGNDGGEGGSENTSGEVTTAGGEASESNSSEVSAASEAEVAAAFGENTTEVEEASNVEINIDTMEIKETDCTENEIAEAFSETTKEQTEDMHDPTLTEEQLAIVKDMETKGEMEVMPSQLGDTIIGGSNERMSEVHVDMPYNNDGKYDPETFIEQAKYQEAGLNQLTVQEFLDNYSNRNNNGRSEEGTKAQEQYSDGLKVSVIDEKMQEGKSFDQAQKEATEELASKASLHNPNQIAGGKATVISSKGDSSVNSALGSLWGHGRANELHSQISDMSKSMTAEEKATTYLNVRIDTHPKS